jgi:hypothetical protein
MDLRRREYLGEAIAVPMREPVKQVKFLSKFLVKETDRVVQILSVFDRDKRSNNVVKDITRSDYDGTLRWGFDVPEMRRWAGRISEWTAPQEDQSPTSWSNGVQDYIKWFWDNFSKLKYLAKSIEEADKDEWEYYIEDGAISESDVKAILLFPKIYRSVEKRVNSVMARLEKLGERVAVIGRAGMNELPPHEKIEIMYHASPKARQLARTGFSEKGKGGVGLSGSNIFIGTKMHDSISFTYDLNVAREIARVFKELAMAARGELKSHTILDWAKREGVLNDVLKASKMTYNLEPARSTRFGAVHLYMTYLWFQKFRTNPVFSKSTREAFKQFSRVNPRDVGVVVAKVNLADTKGYSQHHAPVEREIRVLPKDVVKIIKVI